MHGSASELLVFFPQKFRQINVLLKNFTINWFHGKKFVWQWISRFSTLCSGNSSKTRSLHCFYGKINIFSVKSTFLLNTVLKSRQKHDYHFFRQINVFTKELISRKFLSVIAFCSTFPIVTGLCNDRYSETRAVKSALLQQTVLYCSSMDDFVFLTLVTLKQSFHYFCLHLMNQLSFCLNLHQCDQTIWCKSL